MVVWVDGGSARSVINCMPSLDGPISCIYLRWTNLIYAVLVKCSRGRFKMIAVPYSWESDRLERALYKLFTAWLVPAAHLWLAGSDEMAFH